MVRDVLRRGNTKKIGGLLLVVLGALVLLYGGIHFTMQDAVEGGARMPVAPLAGVLLLAAGVAVLFVRRRRM